MTERRSFTQSLASFPLLQHVSFLSESGTQHGCPSWAKHPADGASAHPDGKQQPSLTTATSLGASLISLSVTPSHSEHVEAGTRFAATVCLCMACLAS